MRGPLRLMAALCASVVAVGAGAAFNVQEQAAIEASAGSTSDAWYQAKKIASAHGKAADRDALVWLLDARRADLLDAMTRAWPADRQATIEQLAIERYDDPPAAASLLFHLRAIRLAALAGRVLDDVDALAAFRAEQSARCQLVPRMRTRRVREPRPGDYGSQSFDTGELTRLLEPEWEPQCGEGAAPWLAVADDDVDEDPVQWRRRAALVAVERIELISAERDPTRHLAKLSLRPNCVPQCSRSTTAIELDVPEALVRMARKRKELLPYDDIVALLRALETRGGRSKYVHGLNELLISMLAEYDTHASSRELADLILRRARRGIPDLETYKMAFLPLGARLPDAQVELEPLRRAMSSALGGSSEVDFWYKRVEAENRSLREPSAASLVLWMGHPKRERLVPYLLDHGAAVNGRGASGLTPLMAAAISAPEFMATLIDRGADPNAHGLMGRTALMAALQHEVAPAIPAILQALLSAGAEVDARDQLGWSALHIAASRDAAAVTTLLRAGAAVDARGHHGETPLFYAARADTARALLAAGADPNRENAVGESAFSHRSRGGPPEVASILAQAGGALTPAQAGRRFVEFGKDVATIVLIPFGWKPH